MVTKCLPLPGNGALEHGTDCGRMQIARGSQALPPQLLGWVAAFVVMMQCVSGLPLRAEAADRHSARFGALDFHIAAQPLADALDIFARLSGRDILYEGDLAISRRSAEVDGVYTPAIALQILLAGTGLQPDTRDDGFFILTRQGVATQDGARKAAGERAYYGQIQAALRRTFCRGPDLPDDRRVAARLWIGSSGEVLQARGLAPADGGHDRIAARLRGVRIGPPPPGFAQPITIVIQPGALDDRRECAAASPTAVP